MFHKVYVELSDVCGLSCSFCTPDKNRRGKMSMSLFSDIIKQVKNKTRLIALHVLGDPLALKDIDEYIQACEEDGVRVDIVTTGIFMKGFETFRSRAIHQVSFSLDAAMDVRNRGLYDADALLERIFRFCEFRNENKLDFFINLRMFRPNEKLVSKIVDHFKITNLDSKNTRLGYKIFLRFHKEFEWNPSVHERRHKSREALPYCHGSIRQIAILSNGIVTPCCICADEEIVLGDVSKNSLRSVIDSSEFSEFARSIKTGINLNKKCKRCSFRGV